MNNELDKIHLIEREQLIEINMLIATGVYIPLLISQHYLTASFPKLLEKNGLRHIRFHDLRHMRYLEKTSLQATTIKP